MKIKILGSGGSIALPKPLCFCNVCNEAREKGIPYKRNGCSIYIEDINSLFDTPEDIIHSLNENKIRRIDNIFYSHLDPDHTMGIRVIELLRKNWLDVSPQLNNLEPINVIGLDNVISDLYKMRNGYGSSLEYYSEYKQIVNVKKVNYIDSGDFDIYLLPVENDITSTVFVITDYKTKIIYAPCDVKPFPNSRLLYNADLLIIGGVIPNNTIKNGVVITSDNELYNDLFSLEEITNIKNKYCIHKVVITHLEEDWGLSYDEYEKLAQKLDDIYFAYDGMEIKIGE